MSDFILCIAIAGLAGAVGGFLARVVPAGNKKVAMAGAPTEVGAFLATMAGAAAGVGSILLSADFSQLVIVGNGADLSGVSLGAGDVVQAFSVGLVGLKWLVNHQDSQTLRQAVAEAAAGPASATIAGKAAGGKPRDVLRAAQGL
jgi:hypothetical protein